MNKSFFDVNGELNKYKDPLYKKLCLLYSLKWQKKNCNWDASIFKGIAKLGGERRNQLYDSLIAKKIGNYDNLSRRLDNFLNNEVNMQTNLALIRRRSGLYE